MKKSVKNQAVAFSGFGRSLERRVQIYLTVAFIYIYFLTSIFL